MLSTHCANCHKPFSKIYHHENDTCPWCGWVEGSRHIGEGADSYGSLDDGMRVISEPQRSGPPQAPEDPA